MKKIIQKLLKKVGFQLKEFPTGDLARRIKIINNYNIDTIFDIGANVGNYAMAMRELGYSKRIIAFEPLTSAFSKLADNVKKDKNLIINNYALGNNDIKSFINVSGGNSESSSILNMLPLHITTASTSEYIAKQEIEIRKLDSIFNDYCTSENNVMIKIDTQGYEKNVIDGAFRSLENIKIIQLEMSIVPLYEGEILFDEMIGYLGNKGFKLFSLETGYSDSLTGQLFQMDGIFVQK